MVVVTQMLNMADDDICNVSIQSTDVPNDPVWSLLVFPGSYFSHRSRPIPKTRMYKET